jgi:two-component system, sensor histidine kinase
MNESKPLILHIEDDEANRYAVKRILEKSGFEVVDAHTGEEGIKEASRILPDLIILDIKLPDVDGFEVCRKIKAEALTNAIPVLQTSASFVNSEHKVEGLESGADGYLAQPIEAAVLVATVRSLLRIRKAEKMANEAMRPREEVHAIVSHDLRNPLTFIMLQSMTMGKALSDGKLSVEDAVVRMKKINNSCLKMNRLIQDILDVTSMEKGNLSLVKRDFPISLLLKDIETYYEDIALQQEISLLCEANGLEKEIIIADRERLQQVLGNLVSNAMKFSLSGSTVRVTVTRKDKGFEFCVIDQGSGIAEKDLPHVFNRYYQGHPERKSGYGIGLSIVKGVTEAHGGTVEILSQESKGTTVKVYIPKG